MKNILKLLQLILICLQIDSSFENLPNIVRIGALFTTETQEQELSFQYSIDQINKDLTLLATTTLIPHVENVEGSDSFLIQNKVCSVLRNGVVAIFGPQDSIDSMQVQSICEAFEIPLIETRSDFEPYRADLSISLFPNPSLMISAYIDLIKEWRWKSFAIIYEYNSEIINFKEFFKLSSIEGWNIKLFQLMPNIPYRDILRNVKQNDCLNIILSAKLENIPEIFRQSLQSGIFTEHHHYLIMNLDFHTIDLSQYKYSRTKITSFKLVQQNYFETKHFINEWTRFAEKLGKRQILVPPKYIRTETALIYDGIKLLSKALSDLDVPLGIQPISCNDGEPWPHGSSLINYMRRISFYGMTGLVKFDGSGFRSDISLEILTQTEQDFDVSAKWSSGKIEKLENWTKHYLPNIYEIEVLRIVSAFNDPFFMQRNSSTNLTGNARYEGFVIDLIDELAEELNFRYILSSVKDGKWGAKNKKTGQWNGMVGEVMRGEVDLAIADLTINAERETAIDFTYPFLSTGITILYKKPTKVLSLWSFMLPFSQNLWILMFAVIITIGIIQVYVGRFTPYEWGNNTPCRVDQVLENPYRAVNSFWFAIGATMQQGSDITPKALSTRVISGVWFFFSLIIVSSYTANLAAFLTVEDSPLPFDNVGALANQTKIKYGCLENGATHRFFKSSNIPIYKKMADFMDNNREVLKSSNSIGRDAVEKANGKYAFFMESATIEYITERYCNLTQVGGLLDNKAYGIATKKGSKWRTPLSETILKLQESGVLRTLKERWWKQKYGGGSCLSKPSSTSLVLGVKNVGGVFLILICGSIFSTILAFYELFTKTLKERQESFCGELIQNLKFSLRISQYVKPVKRKTDKTITRSKSYISEKSISISAPNLQPNYNDFY